MAVLCLRDAALIKALLLGKHPAEQIRLWIKPRRHWNIAIFCSGKHGQPCPGIHLLHLRNKAHRGGRINHLIMFPTKARTESFANVFWVRCVILMMLLVGTTHDLANALRPHFPKLGEKRKALKSGDFKASHPGGA